MHDQALVRPNINAIVSPAQFFVCYGWRRHSYNVVQNGTNVIAGHVVATHVICFKFSSCGIVLPYMKATCVYVIFVKDTHAAAPVSVRLLVKIVRKVCIAG